MFWLLRNVFEEITRTLYVAERVFFICFLGFVEIIPLSQWQIHDFGFWSCLITNKNLTRNSMGYAKPCGFVFGIKKYVLVSKYLAHRLARWFWHWSLKLFFWTKFVGFVFMTKLIWRICLLSQLKLTRNYQF